MDSTLEIFLENSSKSEIVQFIKELLNRSESLQLRVPDKKTEGVPELLQGFDGKDKSNIICEICNENPDIKRTNNIISHLNSFFPNKLYVIILTQVFIDDQEDLKKSFAKYSTIILDIDNLKSRIKDFPDLQDIINNKRLETSGIESTAEEEIYEFGLDRIKNLIRERKSGNFWWLNTFNEFWDQFETKDDKDRHLENLSDLLTTPLKIDSGDIVISSYPEENQITGIFEFVGYNETREFGNFKGLYEFKKKTSYDELSKLPQFGEVFSIYPSGSLHELGRPHFQEIINTTELGQSFSFERDENDWKESDPEINALYEDDSENESPNDKIPFHNDVVSQEDKLGRAPIAKAFVDLIKKDVFTDEMNHAFMVHLQGEWGAGKSTFLNLIEKQLNEGEENWIVVKYNAWQNQHLIPPWWTFIDQIYRQSNQQLCSFNLWWKEKWRRIIWYSGWQKILAFVFTLGFVTLLIIYGNSILNFLISAPEANENIDNVSKGITLGIFSKLLISLGSVVGMIYSFSKFLATPFFINSAEDATSFVRKSADPLSKIKSHFESLIDNINSKKENRQLAIFIDDIDRCNRTFIIQLLEGIQTLFKEKRVLYIVAGDKTWISTSFENTYSEFNTDQSSNQGQLGELFLEKAFQLSLRMPNISEDSKKMYWSHILGISEKEVEEKVEIDKMTPELKKEVEQELNSTKEDIASPVFIKEFEKKHNLSSDAASSIIIEKKNSDQEYKHLLKDLHGMVETNPRSIIRLANNYTMTRSTLIAERKDVNAQKLFRWLILKDLYPNAAEVAQAKSTIKEFEGVMKKEVTNKTSIVKCTELLKGKKETHGDSLTIRELKMFEGL